MDLSQNIATVSHAIQMAVAPVFLLTGVGSLLAVLAGRLGRIVDRFRLLEGKGEGRSRGQAQEMETLSRRARLVHRAIRYCVICALLVCIVIAVMFIGVGLSADLSVLVACLFVAAMVSLIVGLLYFLREIQMATLRIEQSDQIPPIVC